jgi:hypothetical protein
MSIFIYVYSGFIDSEDDEDVEEYFEQEEVYKYIDVCVYANIGVNMYVLIHEYMYI